MISTFGRLEPISKKTRVVALLREAIVSGTLKPGEPIVEGKIAQQFGVGQGLIREALIDLEHQGFVQRTPFSGTQVSQLSLEDVHQIFDIRIELEPLAFSLAGHRATPQQIEELQDLAAQVKQGASPQELDTLFANQLVFRKKIWELSGNRYLQQALERVVIPLFALYVMRRTDNSEEIFETALDCIEHQDKILQAYRDGNIQEANRVARDFLVSMKAYVGNRLPPRPGNDPIAEVVH